MCNDPRCQPPLPPPPLAQLLLVTVVPKFIQSSYYEDVLEELFLDETEANAASNDDPPSVTAVNKVDALVDSLEAVRHDPEAMGEKIAEAVAVAAAAARAEGEQKSGSADGKEVRPTARVYALLLRAHSCV